MAAAAASPGKDGKEGQLGAAEVPEEVAEGSEDEGEEEGGGAPLWSMDGLEAGQLRTASAQAAGDVAGLDSVLDLRGRVGVQVGWLGVARGRPQNMTQAGWELHPSFASQKKKM